MKSNFFGVSFNKKYKTWQVALFIKGKLLNKSGYATEIDAAKDVDKILIYNNETPKNFFKKSNGNHDI